MKLKKFAALFLFFSFGFALFAQDGDAPKAATKTVISILAAQKTEYAKSDEGNDVIVLIGSVKLSVEQGNTKTIVTADTVTYERERQRLYAQGNVVLEKMSGSKVTETITADSILFNSENMEGVFNNGRVTQNDSDMIKIDSKSSLVVDAQLFGRSSTGVIGFKNGNLSFCDEDEPHWKINAQRIWLLPGNEFAFLNAVFSVGYIPVLYLPFFYYPKDEMIFNPVMGYDKRKGYYLQTSTYFIGRKSNAKTDSNKEDFFSFLNGSSNKKQVREGLFLHNLDEEATNLTSNYLRLLGDYYTTLGGLVGIQGNFSPNKVVTSIEFSALTGFSFTVFKNMYGYTIYDYTTPDPDTGKYLSYYDSGYFLGFKVPFRFNANYKMTLSYSPITFNLNLPLYSDPFFENDFLKDRSESMNWLSIITNGLNDNKDDTTSVVTGVSSYTWLATMNLNPKISGLNPYITTLNLSNLKSSILFASKVNQDLTGSLSTYSPNRKFYYPSQIVPASGTINLAGTLYSYPAKSSSQSSSKAASSNTEKNDSIKFAESPSFLKVEEETEENSENTSQTELSQSDSESEKSKPVDISSYMPDLKTSAYSQSTSTDLSYSLTYSLTPTLDSLIMYNGDKTTTPENISFESKNFQSSYYKISAATQLNSTLSLFNSLLSMSNVFKFTPQYQKHPIISEEYYPTIEEREKIALNDLAAYSMNLVNQNSISVKPFLYLPVVYDTNFSWNSNMKIVDTEFTGTVAEPEWTYNLTKWDKNYITTHNLTFNLVTKENDMSQTLSLVATLPPTKSEYTLKLGLTFPFLTFSAETGFEQLEFDKDNDGVRDEGFEPGTYLSDYAIKPFKQSVSMNFFKKALTLTQSFQYDIEENNPTSLSFSVAGWGATLSYSMQYTLPYVLDANKGWVAQDQKKFLPYNMSLSYTLPSEKYRWWKNRITFSPGLTTSITYDMIRPTNSNFVFTPSFSFEINSFLTLTFSAKTQNDLLFRYFQDLFNYDVKIPGETNIFKDLFYSFDFAHRENREMSGFKMKSISVSLTHDLHDWNVKSEFKVEPRLLTDRIPYEYKFDPYFSLSVVWKPMENFKTQIEDKYGDVTLNP